MKQPSHFSMKPAMWDLTASQKAALDSCFLFLVPAQCRTYQSSGLKWKHPCQGSISPLRCVTLGKSYSSSEFHFSYQWSRNDSISTFFLVVTLWGLDNRYMGNLYPCKLLVYLVSFRTCPNAEGSRSLPCQVGTGSNPRPDILDSKWLPPLWNFVTKDIVLHNFYWQNFNIIFCRNYEIDSEQESLVLGRKEDLKWQIRN